MPRTLTAWGIDVGATAVRAMKLRREGEKIHLEAMEVVEHRQFLTEPDVNRREVVRESLAKLLQRHPLHGETVFVSVASSNSFARFVKLPPVEPRKIPDIVRFEAIQQIPFPLDQVIWDYHTFQSADSPDVEIGIFAIKTDVIHELLSDFQSLDIAVEGVQLAPLAIYNTLMYEGRGKDRGTIVLDLGAEHTDLLILDQGRLWLRHVNLGGNSFTELLARGFRLPFQKAETLKRSAASSKWARQIFQVIRPNFADMVTEIQRSIGYYNSAHRESRLEQILGLGNSFRLANLQKYLQQYLHMPVARLDGLNRLEVSDTKLTAALPDQALGMSAACGLALQAVGAGTIISNLLPPAVARRILWRRKQLWFAATAALFLFSVILAGVKYYASASSLAAGIDTPEMAAAQKEIQAERNLLQRYNSISDTAQQSLRRVKSYLHLTRYRSLWPALLNALYASLPQASPQAAAHGKDWSVVIQNMSSTFSSHLTSGASATGGNPGGGGFNPAARGFPGAMPGAGGPPGMLGAPNNGISTNASTGAVAGAPGFAIQMTGYTCWKHPYAIMEFFRHTLNHLTSPDPAQPFHGEVQPGSLLLVPIRPSRNQGSNPGFGNGGNFTPWGAHLGPFASVFSSEFFPAPKRRSPSPAGANGRNQFLPGPLNNGFNNGPMFQPNGAFRSARQTVSQVLINPDTRRPLRHVTTFRLTLLVYLGAPPPLATGPPSAAPAPLRRGMRPNIPPTLGIPGRVQPGGH